MLNKLIIGNWKMNKTFSETKDFVKEFNKLYHNRNAELKKHVEYGIATPFTNLAALNENKHNINVVAQDVSKHLKGAYTGEVSISMLKDLGTKYVILGHSERRQYHNESDEDVNAKAKLVLENGLIPVICVGETLEQYEQGITKEVVKKQIEKDLEGIDSKKVVIAYEPIWAIGTGKVATPEIAQEVCEFIRDLTHKETIIQYGGSVNTKNVAELSKQKDINGFLVGGASLEAKDFFELLVLAA